MAGIEEGRVRGTGRSLRENAERKLTGHIHDAAEYLTDFGRWPLRGLAKDAVKGVCSLLTLAIFVALLILCPLSIPFAGVCRKYNAVKRYRRELKFYGEDTTI